MNGTRKGKSTNPVRTDDKSKWTLIASFSKKRLRDSFFLVRLESEPMPEDIDNIDPHPYERIVDWKDMKKDEALRRSGVYEEYVADNEVTRAIVDLLSHPERLNRASGSTDWRWYRARLVNLLDSLWD